jgi:negative regulator of sigma E activity
MATQNDGTTGEKLSDNEPPLRTSYPDGWRGVRHTADADFSHTTIDSPLFSDDVCDPDGGEVSIDVRYSEADPETVQEITLVVSQSDSGQEITSVASVDPDTAAEIALTILDAVRPQL